MEQIADNQESMSKRNKSGIDWAILFWAIFGVVSLTVIVVLVYGQIEQRIVRDAQRVELQASIEYKRQQLHIENMKGMQAEMAAWDRVNKSMRSVRTEKERISVSSEATKLKALSAERERIYNAATAELNKAKAELERTQ